ncbi:hypothetical protein PENTCL1PPCAC_27396, partial [Pristionchus entomophagus]
MTFLAFFLVIVAIIVGQVCCILLSKLELVGITIIIMSIVRCYSAYAIAFSLLAFVIERLFATILVHDYEKKKRSWIANSEFFVVSISGVAISLDTTFKAFLPPGANLVIVVLVSLIAGVIAIILYFYNCKRLARIVTHRTQYTLPERYQLEENIKAFKFLLTIAVPGAFFVGILFSLLIIRLLLREDRSVWLISGAAFDAGVSTSFFVWGSIIFFLQPTWRETFLHETARLFNKERVRAPKIAKRSSTVESELYFNSLISSWDT